MNTQKTPPIKMPVELINLYTMNGSVGVEYNYKNGSDSSGLFYSKNEIEEFIKRISNRETHYYGSTDTWLYEALDKYNIADSRVVIFGSTIPWYESIAINRGCRKCCVIEYGDRDSDYEGISFLKPNSEETFSLDADFGFSISSFEHSGLGRYGDPLDPDGDIKAMKISKKIIRKGGIMFLSIPVGKDKVVWNIHRVYGDARFGLLTKGWEIIDSFGFEEKEKSIDRGGEGGYQPVFVLKNI